MDLPPLFSKTGILSVKRHWTESGLNLLVWLPFLPQTFCLFKTDVNATLVMLDVATSPFDFDLIIRNVAKQAKVSIVFYSLLLFLSRTPRDQKTGTRPCLNRSTN